MRWSAWSLNRLGFANRPILRRVQQRFNIADHALGLVFLEAENQLDRSFVGLTDVSVLAGQDTRYRHDRIQQPILVLRFDLRVPTGIGNR